MNDRRQKREDDEAGMGFELRTHRIERHKKIGLNLPTSLDNPRVNKESQDQVPVRQSLNHNPYNVIYESSCKLHPSRSYSNHFSVPHPYAPNKFNNHQYEQDSRFPNYCNDSYYAKCDTPPLTPLNMPPATPFSQPSSPRIYFQKPAFSHSHQGTPLSPVPSPPLSTTSVQPSLSPVASATGSLSNLAPRIVRPTSQGTIPTDVNLNPPPSPKVTEVNVLLKNQVMVCLEVEDVQMVTCRDLIGMILDEPEVGLPREAEDVFALWLISPLFEVQLKPEHKPLYVLRKWQIGRAHV